MIGPWEILLRYKQNPEGDSLELTRNMAIAVAEDIEKYCTGLDRLEAENERLRAALKKADSLLSLVITKQTDRLYHGFNYEYGEYQKLYRAALNPEVKK